jgi:hypothetical protein
MEHIDQPQRLITLVEIFTNQYPNAFSIQSHSREYFENAIPQILLYLARHHHTPYGGLVLVEQELEPLERISIRTD